MGRRPLGALGIDVTFGFEELLIATVQIFVCMAIGGAVANTTAT